MVYAGQVAVIVHDDCGHTEGGDNAGGDQTSQPTTDGNPTSQLASDGHVVLGKSIGLAERAAKIGGSTLMRASNWRDLVMQAINDSGTKISVVLDDVPGSSVYGRVMAAVQRAASNTQMDPFDWEMQQLYANQRVGTVDFREAGNLLENPWK